MELLFDTGNLEEIKEYMEYYPITGVTSNPSILKAEGKIEFFKHLRFLSLMCVCLQAEITKGQGGPDSPCFFLEMSDVKLQLGPFG